MAETHPIFITLERMNSLHFVRHFIENKVIDENRYAYTDCTVRHIKCGPVQIADIKIQKIDHNPHPNPIDHISDCPSQDQGKTAG